MDVYGDGLTADGPLEPTFRSAQRDDCALILEFIKKLASYEKMEADVVATPAILEEWLFDKRGAEVFFAVIGGMEVAYALFYTSFSTFLGRSGLYLEDVYVLPEYRGRGIGKAIFRFLARLTEERGYGRFEWACLDWNTPSIEFYRSLGAEAMAEWTTFRLSGDALAGMNNPERQAGIDSKEKLLSGEGITIIGG